MTLEELGWAEPFASAFARLKDERLAAARVSVAQREHYALLCADGAYDAELSGRLRHSAAAGDLPVVGDWVAARLRPEQAQATIVERLPRRGTLVRKRPDAAAEPQVLCANLDVVLLITSLNRDFNPRRIERALAMIHDAVAQPVLVLSKLDLCATPGDFLAQANAVARSVPVHALCALTGEGLDSLATYLRPGRTLALLGSSGVGKSTLLNALLGNAQVLTQPVRDRDDKGRHTTTRRELFRLPGGALLIDTPGMRELALWDADAGLTAAFEDISALTQHCRFPDCQHHTEPGCAVRAALELGTLQADRHASYLKLQRELAFEARRHDPRASADHKHKLRRMFKERKRQLKHHHKK